MFENLRAHKIAFSSQTVGLFLPSSSFILSWCSARWPSCSLLWASMWLRLCLLRCIPKGPSLTFWLLPHLQVPPQQQAAANPGGSIQEPEFAQTIVSRNYHFTYQTNIHLNSKWYKIKKKWGFILNTKKSPIIMSHFKMNAFDWVLPKKWKLTFLIYILRNYFSKIQF